MPPTQLTELELNQYKPFLLYDDSRFLFHWSSVANVKIRWVDWLHTVLVHQRKTCSTRSWKRARPTAHHNYAEPKKGKSSTRALTAASLNPLLLFCNNSHSAIVADADKHLLLFHFGALLSKCKPIVPRSSSKQFNMKAYHSSLRNHVVYRSKLWPIKYLNMYCIVCEHLRSASQSTRRL